MATTPSYASILKSYTNQSTNDINNLYNQQKKSQLDLLKSQRASAISKINQQKKDTKQQYYTQRNQQDVVNQQNVQKLRELMASHGLSSSGENITAQAQANSDRQNSLNSLNLQEQSKMNDYANQINDWNNPSKDQSIVSNIEADRAKALISAKDNAQEKAWREWAYKNMSAQQLAQLGLSKYEIDTGNASSAAQNQALLAYYNSLGFNSGSGGGGTTSTSSGTASFQNNLKQAISKGVPASWASALSELVRRESSYNPNAQNPNSSAYGYAQFLNSTRKAYEKKTGLSYSDPVNQLVMMAQYVKDRYGTPQNALAFWNKNQWY